MIAIDKLPNVWRERAKTGAHLHAAKKAVRELNMCAKQLGAALKGLKCLVCDGKEPKCAGGCFLVVHVPRNYSPVFANLKKGRKR